METNLAKDFLKTAIGRLKYYKDLGDKAFAQLKEGDFHYSPGEESNSVAVIVQHMHGNMMSRWTNFLTEDGEKTWRKRDQEFETVPLTREAILQLWEEGWNCFLTALSNLEPTDLQKSVIIRGESLTVVDAINRQLAHYPYHIGQIVFLARMVRKNDWKSLSIPRGQSEQYNNSADIKDPAKNFR